MTDVIDQVRPEFDQLGVEEAVLQELLRLWELRLAQSRAADFTQDERMAPVARQFPMLSHEEAAQQTQLLLKQEEEAKAVSVYLEISFSKTAKSGRAITRERNY